MKKWLALLLCGVLLLSCCGCNKKAKETTPATTIAETTAPVPVPVGLCLPNQTEARWLAEGAALTAALEAKNCQVLLQDANDDPDLQAEQMEKLIDDKVQCIVVAAVDSASLSQSLALAKKAGIPVVAYDRPLINTDGVTAFVGVDYEKLGQAVAQQIIQAKALETAKAEKRKYTVEFLMDTYENQNNVRYYQGIMQGLKSYLEEGVLKCPSERTLFEDVCVNGADAAAAQSYCEKLLTENYEESWPQIWIAGTDALADSCAAALSAKNCPAESWPLLVGQNASVTGVSRIVSGQQLLTSWYDAEELAQACAAVVEAVLAGNDVPATLLMAEIVTAENYKVLLLDTGIFTAEEVGYVDPVPEETLPEETQPEETAPEETVPEETTEEQENPDA